MGLEVHHQIPASRPKSAPRRENIRPALAMQNMRVEGHVIGEKRAEKLRIMCRDSPIAGTLLDLKDVRPRVGGSGARCNTHRRDKATSYQRRKYAMPQPV